MAQINDRTHIRDYVDDEFQVNFSQAVKRLVKSGYLEAPTYIIVPEIFPSLSNEFELRNGTYCNTSDGITVFCNSGQIRFVKVKRYAATGLRTH
ncbi:MAG: hypothetical protein ABR985_00545 [Methanotrichaceae archaeon]